jgi:hypothetical protein
MCGSGGVCGGVVWGCGVCGGFGVCGVSSIYRANKRFFWPFRPYLCSFPSARKAKVSRNLIE